MKSIFHSWRSNPNRRTLSVALILFGILLLTAIPVFAATGINFDQCANGPAGYHGISCPPGTDANAKWTTGLVGNSNSQYQPGEVIPQRIEIVKPDSGATYSVTLGYLAYDTTKQAHAYDYLATYSETVTSAIPCDGITGCSGSGSTFAIPVDPALYSGSPQCGFGAHNPTYPRTANFTIWNGTINATSVYSYSTSKSTPNNLGISGGCIITTTDVFILLTIRFTASSTNDVVIAYGSHIASATDWPGHAAPDITGASYHNYMISCVNIVGCGSQDNQVSVSASPTAVTLSKFGMLEVVPANVTLSWDTASEVNTAGFNVYRAESVNGPYSRINGQLIPSAADKLAGGKYQYLDKSVVPGKTYYYQLEDVELGGAVKRHDPITVNVPAESLFDSTLVRVGSIAGGLLVVAGGLFISLKKLNVF